MSLCSSSDLDFGSEAHSCCFRAQTPAKQAAHADPTPQQRGARSSTSAGRRALGRAGHSSRGAAATARLEQRVKGHRSCVWATAVRGGTQEKPGEERPPQRAPVMRGASPQHGLYAAESPARAASSPLPARCPPAHAHTLPPSSAPQGL